MYLRTILKADSIELGQKLTKKTASMQCYIKGGPAAPMVRTPLDSKLGEH